MRVLIVYVHPEPKSFNGAMKDLAVSSLTKHGHEVIVSDLYTKKWKAVADGGDFLEQVNEDFLHYGREAGAAYQNGTLSPDILAEQEKVMWADVIIFQFPLWWFSMPAILKGWFDRVFTYGFAFSAGQRYSAGPLKGKRAMLALTAGGSPQMYSERGFHGQIEDLLFSINHGILYYAGCDVLPPFLALGLNHVDAEGRTQFLRDYEQRLLTLEQIAPIPYQPLTDYDEQSQLKPGLEGNSRGFDLHVAITLDPSPGLSR